MQCTAKASLLLSVCQISCSIWSRVSAERRDRKLPSSCGATPQAHVRRSELCTQWAIVNVCEVTQNELYRIVGTHFRFVGIMLILLQDTSEGHPLFVYFSESMALIVLPLQRASTCCLCAAQLLPLIMNLCVQFPPDCFEFALIWRARYGRLHAAWCFLNVRLQIHISAEWWHFTETCYWEKSGSMGTEI